MDIPRKGAARSRLIKRILIGVVLAIAIPAVTIALKRMQPAAQSVERGTVWPDTVKRGEMVRQVRGLGTLVPEDIRWIPVTTEASVERILIWPGTKVEPGDVILELTSPELEQSAHDAESKATAAEAELTTMRATLQRELLEQEAKTTAAHSAFLQA